MHATSVRPQQMDGCTRRIAPNRRRPISRSCSWSVVCPLRPRFHTHIVEADPLSGLRTRLGDQRSIAVPAAVSPPWTLRARLTTARRVSTCSPKRDAAQGSGRGRPKRRCAKASHRGCGHISVRFGADLTAVVGARVARSRLGRFGLRRFDVLCDGAYADHWSDPLADPADPRVPPTHSARRTTRSNTASTLLPSR